MTEATTSAPELTVEQQIAALERRIETFPPELRQQWQEVLELTRNRERCRAIEEATRVTLPPDNRWGASTSLPPSNTTEPPSDRPSGWRPLDPISSPPGVDICDRLMDTQDAKDRLEREREYRQYFLDAHWEVKLADEQRRRAQAEQTCHRGPGDADWDIK
jgi:hypothetical protein